MKKNKPISLQVLRRRVNELFDILEDYHKDTVSSYKAGYRQGLADGLEGKEQENQL